MKQVGRHLRAHADTQPSMHRLLSVRGYAKNWPIRIGGLRVKIERENHCVHHLSMACKLAFFNHRHRLPWWLGGKESAANTGDVSSIPGPGRSPGEGHGNPPQYSCLGNLMDRGSWQVTVHGVVKVKPCLSSFTTGTLWWPGLPCQAGEPEESYRQQ